MTVLAWIMGGWIVIQALIIVWQAEIIRDLREERDWNRRVKIIRRTLGDSNTTPTRKDNRWT